MFNKGLKYMWDIFAVFIWLVNGIGHKGFNLSDIPCMSVTCYCFNLDFCRFRCWWESGIILSLDHVLDNSLATVSVIIQL